MSRGQACPAGLLAALLALALATPAQGASAPTLGATWVNEVAASSARLHTTITPGGLSTSYRFDYLTAAAYEANIAGGKEGFAGAAKAPAGLDAAAGSGTTPLGVSQPLSGLVPDTAYRYRAVAKNSLGTVASEALPLVTQPNNSGAKLLDNRGWEMVSPVDKNGGQVDAPGTLAGGGVLQAAAGGGAITYGSAASFGVGAQGAPVASQYIARRGAGWASENITTPMLSGSYGNEPEGVPYRLFAADLSRGLLLNGRHCRGAGAECPVANPPLAGTGAPVGYQNYYLRESSSGGFAALLGAGDLANTPLDASRFDLESVGATEDLRHVVLSSCAALTADATEAPGGPGDCDAAMPNLYEYSAAGLSLVNLLPAQSAGTPGAALAAQSAAISADGSRVYFTLSGDLYLREGTSTKRVDEAAGGGGRFQAASIDGSLAFFTKAGHLWRFDAASEASTDLTPGGGVLGVLGASADGSHVYYLSGAGLFLHEGGTTTKVAAAADASNYPPTSGTARVSADGSRLAFLSSAQLSGYDNTEQGTGLPTAQVYLYEAPAARLACISCNPTFARPLGPSSIPGANPNGQGPTAPHSYKPRALAADGRRLFFDSADDLVLNDSNQKPDVYEWEAQGTGTCSHAGGCLALVSGAASSGASFVDASADGADVFFLTAASLVEADPGSADLYDARVGGGFPVPSPPIACEGDACQFLPSEPEDPAVTTLIVGPGNAAVRYPDHRKRHKAHKKKKAKPKHGKAHRKGKGR